MSADIVQESVPTFLRRVGDHVIQGSNNSAIVLGSDRAAQGVAGLGSGLGNVNSPNGGKGAGSIHLIAGMHDWEGNPDFDKDDTFFYMSMKTDVDKNMPTAMEGAAPAGPAAILKTDSARIVVRRDLKIAFDGADSYIILSKDSCTIKIEGGSYIRVKKGEIVVDGDNIKLGADATERLIKGDTFMNKVFNLHTHISPTGDTTPPVLPMLEDSLSSRKVTVE